MHNAVIFISRKSCGHIMNMNRVISWPIGLFSKYCLFYIYLCVFVNKQRHTVQRTIYKSADDSGPNPHRICTEISSSHADPARSCLVSGLIFRDRERAPFSTDFTWRLIMRNNHNKQSFHCALARRCNSYFPTVLFIAQFPTEISNETFTYWNNRCTGVR